MINYLFSANCNIADVIFPNRLFGEKFVEEKSKTESNTHFHHAYEIGQQLNRRLWIIKY